MPKSDDASCICRNALQNVCCSSDSDSIASRNALGAGSGSRPNGTKTSSLFLTTMACAGSNSSAADNVPKTRMNDENWRAVATSASGAGRAPANVRAT